MMLRRLGSTDLTVTPIGLGLAALGRPAYITRGRDEDLGAHRSEAAMERRCHAVLDAAYAAGIRYIDAARSYGRAEDFLASWLSTRAIAPATVTVGSKWGYAYVGGWRLNAAVHETKDLSAPQLRSQVSQSLAILGRHLQLYQAHSVTPDSGLFEDRGLLDEVARLRARGLTVGLTVTGPSQAETIRRAVDVRVDGINPFQTVQATWNLLEPSAGPALRDAHAQGLGVILKEVFANGRLTDRHGGAEIDPVREQAAALESTVDAIALASALANPWVDVVLTGAVSVDQLSSNLHGLDLVAAVSPPAIAEPPERYWGRRKALDWS
jgi:aryl-alcohol dehydrogenase-like predicted oxidoreductase